MCRQQVGIHGRIDLASWFLVCLEWAFHPEASTLANRKPALRAGGLATAGHSWDVGKTLPGFRVESQFISVTKHYLHPKHLAHATRSCSRTGATPRSLISNFRPGRLLPARDHDEAQ